MPEEAHDNVTLNLRQRESWKISESEGLGQVDRLADELNVTAQTIRRDRNQFPGRSAVRHQQPQRAEYTGTVGPDEGVYRLWADS